MSSAPWTASDDGFLRAYEWVGALGRGSALPTEAAPLQLGPGEVAHARFAVSVSGFFGEDKPYRPGFLLVGGPVGLAVTGDRKSTRLNSSHVEISYAVFCLKK